MSEKQFEAHLREITALISDVWVEDLALDEDMIDLTARFADLPGTTLLYSGGDLDCARFHILGLWPWLTLTARPGRVCLETGGQRLDVVLDPLDALERVLSRFKLTGDDWPEPMAAGLMGYLAYDLKDCLERLPRTSVDELGLPRMLWYAPSLIVVHDRWNNATRLMAPCPGRHCRHAKTVVERFKTALAAAAPAAEDYAIDGDLLTSNFKAPDYHRSIERIIDYIAAGDVYQVNMSQRFCAPFEGSAFALFRHMAGLNPAPFFAFVQAGDHQIVSTSPERFLMHAGGRVEARPIKGTRPRCTDPVEDAAMRRELEASTKDDAELSMIVDLLRNDLGKVCRAGSVRVREHKRLEAYQNVYHLVSIVEGTLDNAVSSADLIRATFPGGSITGCPKVRAMEIIDELETCRRHVYCGSVGYIGFNHTMDLSIAIRTATVSTDAVRFSVGGAVVFDSKPDEEYEETLHKGRTLMSACGHTASRRHVPPMVWFNGGLVRAGAACIPVSDLGLQYGYGFFETIRVDQGKAPLLADHLERFDETWRALMPGEPPDITWADVIGQVIGANGLQSGCAAVKLLVTRGDRNRPPWNHGLLVSARSYTHRLMGQQDQGLHLGTYPHGRQSPLADYKTLNYLFYFQAGRWAISQGFDEALILNPDGTVSETNTANLLIIENRKVIRPSSPAVLPGVMAQALCRVLSDWGYRIVRESLKPCRLLEADQVLATNALMGAVPVLSVDGRSRDGGDHLWMRLNDAVLPRWQGINEVDRAGRASKVDSESRFACP